MNGGFPSHQRSVRGGSQVLGVAAGQEASENSSRAWAPLLAGGRFRAGAPQEIVVQAGGGGGAEEGRGRVLLGSAEAPRGVEAARARHRHLLPSTVFRHVGHHLLRRQRHQGRRIEC